MSRMGCLKSLTKPAATRGAEMRSREFEIRHVFRFRGLRLEEEYNRGVKVRNPASGGSPDLRQRLLDPGISSENPRVVANLVEEELDLP